MNHKSFPLPPLILILIYAVIAAISLNDLLSRQYWNFSYGEWAFIVSVCLIFLALVVYVIWKIILYAIYSIFFTANKGIEDARVNQKKPPTQQD